MSRELRNLETKGRGLMPKGAGAKRRLRWLAEDNRLHYGALAFDASARGYVNLHASYWRIRERYKRIEDRLKRDG